jgi:hypothetical protein
VQHLLWLRTTFAEGEDYELACFDAPSAEGGPTRHSIAALKGPLLASAGLMSDLATRQPLQFARFRWSVELCSPPMYAVYVHVPRSLLILVLPTSGRSRLALDVAPYLGALYSCVGPATLRAVPSRRPDRRAACTEELARLLTAAHARVRAGLRPFAFSQLDVHRSWRAASTAAAAAAASDSDPASSPSSRAFLTPRSSADLWLLMADTELTLLEAAVRETLAAPTAIPPATDAALESSGGGGSGGGSSSATASPPPSSWRVVASALVAVPRDRGDDRTTQFDRSLLLLHSPGRHEAVEALLCAALDARYDARYDVGDATSGRGSCGVADLGPAFVTFATTDSGGGGGARSPSSGGPLRGDHSAIRGRRSGASVGASATSGGSPTRDDVVRSSFVLPADAGAIQWHRAGSQVVSPMSASPLLRQAVAHFDDAGELLSDRGGVSSCVTRHGHVLAVEITSDDSEQTCGGTVSRGLSTGSGAEPVCPSPPQAAATTRSVAPGRVAVIAVLLLVDVASAVPDDDGALETNDDAAAAEATEASILTATPPVAERRRALATAVRSRAGARRQDGFLAAVDALVGGE